MAIGSPQWMYKSGEAYTVDQSLKLNNDDDAKLSWTPSSAGNRKTWTLSVWIKRGNLGSEQGILTGKIANDDTHSFKIASNDVVSIFSRISGSNTKEYYGVSKLRDTGAWYNIVFAFDTTQSTEADRVKIWINGVAESFTGVTAFPEDYEPYINSTVEHNIGNFQDSSSSLDYDGYLAEMHFIDGQAKTQADFGETGTYGEWKPKEYEGSYGTNGFYLPFKNDYTVEGFSTTLFKGVSGESQYIGGSGFRPSLTWIKSRTNDYSHSVIDAVRGSDKTFYTNATNAEDTNGYITGFKPDGFQYSSGFAAAQNYVAWNWDMGANTPTGFGAVTYKGSGSANQVVENMGFSPDLLWIKDRDDANSHHIFDKVRGVNQRLRSDSDAAQDSGNDAQRAFLPDGFRLGATGLGITVNGNDYVAWGWDMGGTSVSNTDGSITSTVMANPTYGQSIVKYTSSAGSCTVGHGLSSAPELILYKTLTSNDWVVYHSSIGNAKKLRLNTNDPEGTTADFNSTSPTSSVFTDNVTGGSTDMIAYAFHSVANYSKIGSYTGNGSTTGTSVTLGFRPAFVMIKVADRTDGGNGAWWMFDSTRSFGTAIGDVSMANSNAADLVNNSNLAIDFNSNGFQLKSSYDEINVNGGKYVYMAFAGGVDSVSDFNTTGNVDARVKANPSYGQSIVQYVGKSGLNNVTYGHGLSSSPEVVITKRRDSTSDWFFSLNSSITGSYIGGRLNTNSALSDTNKVFMSSSLVTIDDINSMAINNAEYISYCFHSVTGYSKFGSYTGNGSSTGTSVTTGFKPAFVMLKQTDGTGNWMMFDSTRSPTNTISDYLVAHDSQAEASYPFIDFNSNGFQLKHTSSHANGNGNTYIYMAFADKREYAYWLDQSGNNNDWTSNNLTESDISVDSPTNNFAILNPLAYRSDASPSAVTFAEGNLKATLPQTSEAYSNMFTLTGKWYFEILYSDYVYGLTICLTTSSDGTRADWTPSVCYNSGGTKRVNSSWSAYGDSYTEGDIIGVALNMDDDEVIFYKNGVSQGTISGGLNAGKAYGLFLSDERGGSVVANFGQDSSFAGNKTAQGNQDSNDIGDFYYTPPSGFLALCTDNLPDVAVTPSEHFNTVLWSGDGASSRAITGVGFQPDFVWGKPRSQNASHLLTDSVRGVTKNLLSNGTASEYTTTVYSSFDTDGFTLGANAPGWWYNHASHTSVAWNWKAGTSVSGNSSGSGTTTSYTGSVNTDAGFSIIKYTGNATAGLQIPHHLGVVPDAIFIKSLTVQSWNCFFPNTSLGATKGLQLDNTGAEGTVSHLNNTMPSTSVVTLGTGAGTNTAADGVGQQYIMYSWANKDGYSKVGEYNGNNSNDGTFVYTGFKPAFLMVKATHTTTSWIIVDNKRNTSNPMKSAVYPNNSNAEEDWTSPPFDFTSNGFKTRYAHGLINGSGGHYIYIAFAETPFKYSNGR